MLAYLLVLQNDNHVLKKPFYRYCKSSWEKYLKKTKNLNLLDQVKNLINNKFFL